MTDQESSPLSKTPFDVSAITGMLSANRWLVVSVTGAALLVAAVLSFTATPYYRASARVLIERDGARVMSIQEIYQVGGAQDDYYRTQYQIFESRAVAETALSALPEADREWFVSQGGDPVNTMMDLRRIRPVTMSRLVDVEAEHPDPAVAERMVDALVDAYVQNGRDRRSTASSQAIDKLRRDAEALTGQMREAQARAQAFKAEHQIVSVDDRSSLASARLERLSEQLSTIERQRSEAEARLKGAQDAAEAGFRSDVPEVLTSEVIGNFKRALLDARSAASELSKTYRSKHPMMKSAEARVASLEEQLADEVSAVYAGFERSHQRAVHEERDVRRRIEEQKKELLELESRQIQYGILLSEAERTKSLHDAIVSRLKEVEVIDDDEATNVHRIGSTERSRFPVRPRKLLTLLFAGLLGFGLSIGLAFARQWMDRTIRTSQDVTEVLRLPTLGVVPRAGETGDELSSDSILAEAFHTVRTALAFSDRGRDMSSVVVTSTSPSEGKSVVSMQMAASYARVGKRVLLVDADLRRPRLHKALNAPATQGLTSYLIGDAALDELVQETSVENLSFLPCGAVPPDPVELLSHALEVGLVESLGESFDLVVIDSPPVGLVTDAAVIGNHTDRVVFVTRSFSSDRLRARRAVEHLQNAGCQVAGVVLNHADVRAERYARRDGGYRSYEYRYAEDKPTPQGAAEPTRETVEI